MKNTNPFRVTLAATCADCGRKLTRNNISSEAAGETNLCAKCWDYAGWENEHSDMGHDNLAEDDAERDGCPVCAGDAPVNDQVLTGNTNTVAKSRSSHAACYAAKKHDATPKGRAACRASR